MKRYWSRSYDLLKQTYQQGGWLAVLTMVLLSSEFFWFVCLSATIAATVAEAFLRPTTPTEFYLAFYFPAPAMLLASMGSWKRAVVFGFAVGLVSGVFAPDGGAWFSYVAADILEAVTFWWLVKKLVHQCSRPTSRTPRLILALMLSISVGALSGAASLWATRMYYFELPPTAPFFHVAAHWACGDMWSCLALFLIANVMIPPQGLSFVRTTLAR